MTMAAVIGAWRPHRLDVDDVGREQDRRRERERQRPFGRTADQEKEQADHAAHQHVDEAAPEHPCRLVHLRVGGGDHGGDRPDRIGVGEVRQRIPDDGRGDGHVAGEPDAENVLWHREGPPQAIAGLHVRLPDCRQVVC
jgi:hypothetical protein